MTESRRTGQAPARYVRLGGIVEGRTTEPEAIRSAVEALEETVRGDLDFQGALFSFSFADEVIPLPEIPVHLSEEVARCVSRMTAHASHDHALESTLHISEVFPDEVVETLFCVQGHELEVLSRSRRPVASDADFDPRSERSVVSSLRRLNPVQLGAVFVAQ